MVFLVQGNMYNVALEVRSLCFSKILISVFFLLVVSLRHLMLLHIL